MENTIAHSLKSMDNRLPKRVTKLNSGCDKTQQRKSHGIPFNPNAQYGHCVNELVICSEYEKSRVMYAARKVHFQDITYLKAKLEMAMNTYM